MNKVICIGESLIDFLPTQDSLTFTAKAGGAPSNVCACVAKLGGKGYFLGKLSSDNFGKFLLEQMHKSGVNTDYAVIDNNYNTALAVVTLSIDGDRAFSFYRDKTADVMLDKNEINPKMFDSGDILHFCSVGLTAQPSNDAHKQAIFLAQKNNCLISFDVNVRLGLWSSQDECKVVIKQFLPFADILKVTDEELEFLTDIQDPTSAVKHMLNMASNAKLLFVTKGKDGVSVYDRNLNEISMIAIDVKVVDTTGAGDCFSGCILYGLISQKCQLTLQDIKPLVEFASYGCGVVISKKGAIESMPSISDIENLKKSMEK